MPEVPASLTAVNAEWLAGALRDAGHEVKSITDLTYTPIGDTLGILGEVGYFDLTYDGPSDVPERLFAKCALDDDIARLYNSIMLFYQREMGFYRDLAGEVPMEVPKPWLTVSDADRHLLLVDYVDGAHTGDILQGTDLETMKRLVTMLAGLHGRYWMDQRVADLPWMFTWRNESILTGAPIVQGFWQMALEKYPDLVPPDVAEVCWEYHVQDSAWVLDKIAQRPWTLIHGDYQLDNMMFTPDGEVTVFDWQGCQISFPAMDLGYLLSASSSRDSLEHEDELLDLYRDELRKAGGPAWSAEELLDDLAWAMVYLVPGQLIPYQQDYSAQGEKGLRHQRRFAKCAEETINAALRWDMVDRIRASGLR